MRLFGAMVVVVILAIAAIVPRAAAQSLRPFAVEMLELGRPILPVAANLADLQRQLGRARAQLKSSGCLSFPPNRAWRRNCYKIRSHIASLERQLAGGRTSQRSTAGGSPRQQTSRPAMADYSRRTFRTICVRVCDGYYYSLSHTASRRRLAQDAERCAGQYPPGEAVLFYHPFPSDDVSQARSLEGERYADQDYAFVFRKAFMPQCAARLHQGLKALKARVFAAVPTLLGEPSEGNADDGPATELVPVARARPVRSSDPETLANRAGGLVPEPIEQPFESIATRIVVDPYYFADGNPGPPATVAGYTPPELKDFRVTRETTALEVRLPAPGRARHAPLRGAY